MPKSATKGNRAVYCAIVGDIIKSKELAPDVRERATRAAQKVFDWINTEYGSSLMAPFGMVRGDGFEGILLTQSYAPDIAQDIIKALYRVDKTKVRISVAMGTLTVTSYDRNVVDGPALHTAYENLEALKERNGDHWLQVAFFIGDLTKSLINSQNALLMALTEGWTERQHEVVWAMEEYESKQNRVSKALGIPASAVKKHVQATNYDVYRQAWNGLTDFLVEMDAYTTQEKPVMEMGYVPFFNAGMVALYKWLNYETAISHFLKSVRLAIGELGEDDPLIIPIYNELASAYIASDEYEKSIEYTTLALRLQKSMPKSRLQYMETLLNKADALGKLKKFGEAEKIFLTLFDLARDNINHNHPFMGTLHNNFAVLYWDMDEYKNALKQYQTSLDISKENEGFISPVQFAILILNIAECHDAVGNTVEAYKHITEAIKIWDESLPHNHTNILRARRLRNKLLTEMNGEA
jgi:tetratricopeptide (TPR) repeat protein